MSACAPNLDLRSRKNATPNRLILMFSGVENCWRMEAADSVVAACAYVGSRSITATEPVNPRSWVRKYATAEPTAAPPTITTSKVCMLICGRDSGTQPLWRLGLIRADEGDRMTIRPRRSVLYMPGSNARALEKAKTLP